MDAIQSTKVAHKVWVMMGEHTGLYQATMRFLESRGETVFHNSDFRNLPRELASLVGRHKSIDMLIVNDLKTDIGLLAYLENIYTICSYMRTDGTGKVIFLLSNDICFNGLQDKLHFTKLKQCLKELMIEVLCFEPC